jgi:hypothetical protein
MSGRPQNSVAHPGSQTCQTGAILPRMRLLACVLFAATLQAQTPAAPDSVTNSGRQALTEQLDAIAAKQTAARRDTIAKIHTKQEAIARQKQVRARMIALLGGPWPEHSPLNPRITGSSDHDGIHIERILFDSQPNFPVTALLYLPQAALKGTGFSPSGGSRGLQAPETSASKKGASAPEGTHKLPAILMAPGHSPAGKAGDAAMALAFAHQGFAVLSYDPLGQGERLQYPDPANPGHTLLKAPTGEHGEAGLGPTLIGDALARYFLIDAIRATDYLLTRPEIDAHRIGAFGCSGGGLMTALTAALDTRIAVAGIACFTTSFDTLLPSIGPQDSEQSTPNFISNQPAPGDVNTFSNLSSRPKRSGVERPAVLSAPILDFPDWSELFAPKPYAIIATTEDMFPFAGAQSTEKESRVFYTLFNAQDDLAFITGPGHHGHLQPITPRILNFFVTHLHSTPDATGQAVLAHATDPIQDDPNAPRPPSPLSAADTQVTPTGQVATSYPQSETVHTLNLKRYNEKISTLKPQQTLTQLQQTIREVTHASATPDEKPSDIAISQNHDYPNYKANVAHVTFPGGSDFNIMTTSFTSPGKHPATLLIAAQPVTQLAYVQLLLDGGVIASAFAPRPTPPGTEETKSPVLGDFYLTELRAELTGNTLMGLRIDDVIHAIDYLAARPDVDPDNITAEASGHMALVLLHAAILDPRIHHINLHALPPTYTDYLHQPIPHDAPQDILPGILLHYDTPDLIKALGPRVTVTP